MAGDPTPPQKPDPIKVLDLTNEPVPTEGVQSPREVPVQIQRIREGNRGRIAMGLLYLISGVVLATFATIAWDWTSQQLLKDLLTAILNPLVGLFGAVIGFYFGSVGRDDGTDVQTQPTKGGGK